MKSLCSILTILLLLTASPALPLTVVGADACRDDCCDHTTHRNDHCGECVACVTGLNSVVPAAPLVFADERIILARLDWPVFVGDVRTDPPLLTPPRPAA